MIYNCENYFVEVFELQSGIYDHRKRTDYGLIDTKLDTEQTQFMKDVVKFILGKETGLNTDMLFWTRIDTSHEGDNFSRDATYEEDYFYFYMHLEVLDWYPYNHNYLDDEEIHRNSTSTLDNTNSLDNISESLMATYSSGSLRAAESSGSLMIPKNSSGSLTIPKNSS